MSKKIRSTKEGAALSVPPNGFDITRAVPSSQLPGGKGGLSQEEIGMIYQGSVLIGLGLPPDVRPYYVASIMPLSRIDDALWLSIGLSLGVRNFTEAQKLCAWFVVAKEKGDKVSCGALLHQIESFGSTDLAMQGIGSAYQMAALLDLITEVGERTCSPSH